MDSTSLQPPRFFMAVCDFAVAYPDGSFTIVRGGIENLHLASLPASANLSVFIDLPGGSLPSGQHALSIALASPEGVRLVALEGSIAIKEPDNPTRIAAQLIPQFQSAGVFELRASIAGLEATRKIKVKIAGAPR